MTIDVQTLVLILTALSGLVWGGYERYVNTKKVDAEYVNNLAEAANKLVETSTIQVEELKKEIAALRAKITHLEEKLEGFGCADMVCPVRVRLHKTTLYDGLGGRPLNVGPSQPND